METLTRDIAEALIDEIKKTGVPAGFLFCAYSWGDGPGWMTYAANGHRGDVIKMLRELADKLAAAPRKA